MDRLQDAVRPQLHIALVGLGPSRIRYLDVCAGVGGRHRYCDQTWVINALGDVLEHDLVFHMDDVRTQMLRAEVAPESNIAAMVGWLRTHPKKVITSIAHPDFPCLLPFPLADVINLWPQAYFNSTAAYAVAYAIFRGATKLSVFGFDFTYPDAHDAEKGRACVEFWLGIAAARGIQLVVPKESSLLDAFTARADKFYGYDFVDLDIRRDERGRVVIEMREHGRTSSAEEIEARYDHSAHPNPMMVPADA